jgi:hypothetical protein
MEPREELLRVAEAHEESIRIMRDCSTPDETRAGFLRVAEIMVNIPGQDTLTSSLRMSAQPGALDDSQVLGVRATLVDSYTKQCAALRRSVESVFPAAGKAAPRAAPLVSGHPGGSKARKWWAIAGIIAWNMLMLYVFVLAATGGGGACYDMTGAELDACHTRNLLLVVGAWVVTDLGFGIIWLVRRWLVGHRRRPGVEPVKRDLRLARADETEHVVCPSCGAGYNTTMVATSIFSKSPLLADMKSWNTRIICKNCKQEIWVSGSHHRVFGKP